MIRRSPAHPYTLDPLEIRKQLTSWRQIPGDKPPREIEAQIDATTREQQRRHHPTWHIEAWQQRPGRDCLGNLVEPNADLQTQRNRQQRDRRYRAKKQTGEAA